MEFTSARWIRWREALRAFLQPKVLTLLFLGFSAGVPLLLIFSSLSLWLREAGVERSAVTFFSWAALAYSFKFIWAPLIDRLPVPILTSVLGRRRAWMLVSQLMVMVAIIWMGCTNPAEGQQALTTMAFAAVLLGFSSATQDIVIDAYRIESAASELQAMMSATYVAGYRVGMLVSGAGALYLASYFGSTSELYSFDAWRTTYVIMAVVMVVGLATTLTIREPDTSASADPGKQDRLQDQLGLMFIFTCAVGLFVATFVYTGVWHEDVAGGPLVTFVVECARFITATCVSISAAWLLTLLGIVRTQVLVETYFVPVQAFFARYGMSVALLLLALVALYRISDIVLGVIANVFYQDLGFDKEEIANIVKTFGLLMTILGGFLGGVLALRFGVMRILFVGALLTVATNLLFITLAWVGHNQLLLYAVISADNLTAGLASAAFIAFLSSLTNIRFTAMQYAIFSSLMTLIPKLLGGYSGTLVDSFGYVNFFLIAAVMGFPALLLVWLVNRHVDIQEPELAN